MPLIIDNLRALFAQQLTAGKSLDRAMAHVITIAYERGLDDGRRSAQAGDEFVIPPQLDVEKWKRENL